MLDHKIAQKAKMKKILSENQYAKWEKMEAHRHKRMGKDHRKHGAKKKVLKERTKNSI